jgi:hypothetical protein
VCGPEARLTQTQWPTVVLDTSEWHVPEADTDLTRILPFVPSSNTRGGRPVEDALDESQAAGVGAAALTSIRRQRNRSPADRGCALQLNHWVKKVCCVRPGRGLYARAPAWASHPELYSSTTASLRGRVCPVMTLRDTATHEPFSKL